MSADADAVTVSKSSSHASVRRPSSTPFNCPSSRPGWGPTRGRWSGSFHTMQRVVTPPHLTPVLFVLYCLMAAVVLLSDTQQPVGSA